VIFYSGDTGIPACVGRWPGFLNIPITGKNACATVRTARVPDFPPLDSFATLIDLAKREDLGTGDVTVALTVPADMTGVGTLYQKSPGVAAGLPIVEHVCRAFDERLTVDAGWYDREGRFGDGKQATLMSIRGPMRSLLSAERTLLNFVQRMSGIATATRAYVDRVAGTRAKILDTRKTLPGFRALDKYAVRAGGGHNHRIGLYDMVLVKDNHLAQLGLDGWAERLEGFIRASRATNPSLPVEVEVVDENQFARMIAMKGVDIILLDNMSLEMMRRCVERRDAARSSVLLEASGGVTLATVSPIAETGVDRISVGALTHSVMTMDISLEVP
jgi:nicotinate-nucleotide pyrophosphorylase (carboxylating)